MQLIFSKVLIKMLSGVTTGDVGCILFSRISLPFLKSKDRKKGASAFTGTSHVFLREGIRFHRRTIGSVITGIWLYASLWALLPLLGWGSYGPEPFGLACSIDWIGYEESLNHSTFIMALATLCTFLPCVVILGTYFGIAWKLHRAYRSIQTEDFQCSNIERKITLVSPVYTQLLVIDVLTNQSIPQLLLLLLLQMAFMISSGFIIAWAPYVAVSFWTMFNTQEEQQVTPSVSLLPCLFAKSSTVYNPFIYFFFKRNSWHKPPCLSRQGFLTCAHQASLPGAQEKLGAPTGVQGSGYSFFGSVMGKPGPDDGTMRAPGIQAASDGSLLG